MKVLRVISSINPKLGGPINGLVNSSQLLVDMGVTVEVISMDNFQDEWVKNFIFPLHCVKSYFGKLRYSPALRVWLEENISNYDVVIIHGLWQLHGHTTAQVCVNRRIPYLLFTHGMLDPWFNRGNRLKHAKKLIYWYLFEKNVVANATRVLFTSEEERKQARTSFPSYRAREAVVKYGCPTPISSALSDSNSLENICPGLSSPYILFLSRIHPKKGIDLLIEAVSKLKMKLPINIKFVVAGPSSTKYLELLKQQCTRLEVADKFIWLPMIQGQTKWEAFRGAEAFILPSHQENFGIVVAEALATSTPVIITNKVNIYEIIQENNAGIICDDTVEGVTGAIEQWLRLSNLENQSMANNALSCYQEHFSIEEAARSLLGILESSLNSEAASFEKA